MYIQSPLTTFTFAGRLQTREWMRVSEVQVERRRLYMSTVNRLDIFATHTHTTPCRTSIYAESSQSLYSNLLRLSPYHITSKAGGHSLPPHNSRRACSRLYSSPPLLVTVVCLCCGRDSRLSITAARAKEEEEQQQQHLSVAQCYNSYC